MLSLFSGCIHYDVCQVFLLSPLPAISLFHAISFAERRRIIDIDAVFLSPIFFFHIYFAAVTLRAAFDADAIIAIMPTPLRFAAIEAIFIRR
jgi:hypothetical protein